MAEKIVKQILDPSLIQLYDQKLSLLMGNFRNGSGFPGSLAVSILKSDFELIIKNEYKILLKSDGTRYLMFIFEYFDSNNRNLNIVDFMDRSYTHYIITASFGIDVFRGTLFDGELVKLKDGRFQFQIFDCLAYCGNYIGQETHKIRLETAQKCISLQYKFIDLVHPFEIVVKEYMDPKLALENLYSEKLFPIDGWILQDLNRPYTSGKDICLFKYKKAGKENLNNNFKENHTIDLKMYNFEGINSLCTINNGKMTPIQSPANISKENLNNLGVYNEKMLLGHILECKWDSNSRLWIPILKRTDKDLPNNLFTYNQTIKNIEQKISPVEMFNVINKIGV